MQAIHDAPVLRLNDLALLQRFCARYGIRQDASVHELVRDVARAFSAIPYENLTKIIKADAVAGPGSAMRYPDEVIADHLRWGTGGTCFSLTAAIIAVYGALGIEAQPLLADRHYGPDTHCGLVIINGGEWQLLDPGYLLFTPVPLPAAITTVIPQGYTTIELRPYDGGRLIELATVVQGSRKVRLVYKREPVDPQAFVKAWIASFAWEMMTYPVVTRCVAGQHIYMQGSSVSVRTSGKTSRTKVEIPESIRRMNADLGISAEIASKAWSIVHGNT